METISILKEIVEKHRVGKRRLQLRFVNQEVLMINHPDQKCERQNAEMELSLGYIGRVNSRVH